MTINSSFNFTVQPPSFISGTTVKMVKKLESLEEERLNKLSKHAKSDMFDRYQRANECVTKAEEVTDSEIIAFTVCSACGYTLKAIKNGAITRLLSQSVTKGLFCNNDNCSFYLKVIPPNKVSDLTNIVFTPQINFATENYFEGNLENQNNNLK